MLKPITFTFTPSLYWSPPGCAKTAIITALAKAVFGSDYDTAMTKYKVPKWVREIFDAHRAVVEPMIAAGCYTLLATDDPVDAAGVLSVKTGVTVRNHPLYWLVASYVPICIFCDELTVGSPEQRAAMLRVSDDSRSLHGMALYPESRVMGAANPPEFAAGAARELHAPELSRWRHRSIGPEYAVEWMNQQSHQWLRVVGVYLRSNLQAALAKPEAITAAVAAQEPFPNPRAWTRAALEIMETEMDALPQYIGPSGSGEFLNWLKAMDLPNPVEILAGREKTVPGRGDSCMATAASIVGLLGDKPAEAALGFAMEWFRLAADRGQTANCIVDLKQLTSKLAAMRISRYARELAPYGEGLKMAGMLK